MNNYYIYILSNSYKNVLYVDVTNDLMRRVYDHKNDLIDGSTKRYKINQLIYFEIVSDITSAISREKQIKSWSRKRKEHLIESENKDWVDLYSSICS